MPVRVGGVIMSMSTPEFFLFRKCVDGEGHEYASEMLSNVATCLTRPSLPEGTYEEGEPQTSMIRMLTYLAPLISEEAGQWFGKAMECVATLIEATPRTYEEQVRKTMEIATD